jgi:lipopolysaccharide transport system permease protein
VVAYCQALWRCRYFWLSLVWQDLRARYRGSALGMGWSLLQPIAMTTIFTMIFCRIFGREPGWYAPYVMTGLACWGFIVNCATTGCTAFIVGESYIRHFPAPMAIYPLRVVLGLAFHMVLALGLAQCLAAWNLGVFHPLAFLCLFPSVLLMILFGWALATLTGLLTVYFRDTKQITEVSFQAFFYVTPVFYDEGMLTGTGSKLAFIMELNPFVPLLKMLRGPIMHGGIPHMLDFAKAAAVTMVLVLAASYALSRLEKRLIFHL